MSRTIHASDVSSMYTTGSTSPEQSSNSLPLVPATRDARVVVLAPITVNDPMPDGFVDIDSIVEAEESDPSTKEAIAAGRRVVAENYYAGDRSLSSIRLRKGWSQKELARRLGTSQSYVARLEAGSIDPQLSTLRRLADVLEVEISPLLEAMAAGTRGKQ